ncbi:MAG: isochorismate synthase [Bacillota bacterium]
MLTAQYKVLYESLKEGIERSRETLQPVVISYVKKIKKIDNPFSFFRAGRTSFLGERIFWSEPSRNMYIVGIGHAYTIDALSPNQRFSYVKNKWQQLLKQHIIKPDFYPLIYGTGPILLGGFSFDPYKQKTGLWNKFAEGKMVLPAFMLTITDGQAWLTTNIIVDKYDCPDEKTAWLEEQKRLLLTSQAPPSPKQNHILFQLEVSPEKWMDSVTKVTKDIRAGLVEKVVLARELRIKTKEVIQAEDVLARLLKEQPSSYIFAVESGDNCFIGASPERLVKKQENEFLSMCLAGTIARGKSVEEDEKLGNELLHDEKNLHEHLLVVQMIKNAMEEGCKEIIIPEKPTLYKVRDVQHLYTPVVGRAKDNVLLLDMVEKLHPTPALGGYPRDKALEKIREEEKLERGWYAAPIGWVDMNGDGEFAVAIRSGLFQGKWVSLFAGCGIVGDSHPESEYKETQMKFKPMLSALRG